MKIKIVAIYALAGMLSLLAVLFLFNIFHIDITIPLNYTGDALQHYNFAKNIELTGWWGINPNLGAPLQQNLYDFPLSENFSLIILKSLILLGFTWITSVNAFFILTFPLTTILSLYVFKKFKISYFIGIPLAIVYSFLPYHFYRGVNHLFLSAYYVVPLSVLFAHKLAIKDLSKIWSLVFLAILIASGGAYYTFFSVLIASVGFIIGLLKDGLAFEKDYITKSLILFVVIGTSFILNLSPSIVYSYKYGRNLNAVSRHPKDTETFGLKLTQLILPVEDHNLEIFNKIRKKYKIYGLSSLINENQYSSLGITATVGFLLLLGLSVVLVNWEKTLKLNKDVVEKLKVLGAFNLVLLLFGTIGGFSLLISVYFMPVFRSVNRVSIFIGFLSLLSLGLLLDQLAQKKRKLVVAISCFIIPLALYDQVSIGVLQNFTNESKGYASLVSYARRVEEVLDVGDKVYTLPFGQYPEGSEKKLMKIPLLTDTLVWSTGALRWRSANYWQYKTSKLEPKDLLDQISREGFTGLLIYSLQYGTEDLSKIEGLLRVSPLIGPEGKLYFYDIRNYIKAHGIQVQPTDLFYHVSGNCLHDYNKSMKVFTKYWCVDKAYITFENVTENTLERLLTVGIELPEKDRKTVQKLVTLPPGVKKVPIHDMFEVNSAFQKPYNETIWPTNLGYPNFIIHEVAIE